MTVTIRLASDADLGILASLQPAVHDLHVSRAPEFFKTVDQSSVVDLFRSMLQRPDVRAWIAESDGTAVGYALTVVHERVENVLCRARRVYEIDQVAVASPYRRIGVARALISRALDDARSRGIRDVELSSWSFNTEAHAAFQALGFEPKVVRFGRASF